MSSAKVARKNNVDEDTHTRVEIIKEVQREIGSYTLAKKIVTDYFMLIEKGLIKDGLVKIHNFGRFMTIKKRERVGRNPRSGETKQISARTVVSFRPSNKLRNEVRSSHSDYIDEQD